MKTNTSDAIPNPAQGEEFVREWIWFHHIYGKQKRRNLISWAKDMDVTGFSLVRYFSHHFFFNLLTHNDNSKKGREARGSMR